MKRITRLTYWYLILIGILSIQACNSQPADHKTAVSGADSSTPAAMQQQWLDNLNEAQARSVKEKKPILAYFTASDTCGLCKQLEADVFLTPVFKSWSDKSVVLFRIDAVDLQQVPQGSEDQNTAIARSLKVSRYPTIWILSVTHEPENGRFKVKPKGYTGFQPTPEKLIGALQGFMGNR